MKKALLVSLLLGSIILAGCGQQQLSQDELFEKQQECAKYKPSITKEIEEVNLWWKNEPGVSPHNESLSEIFYSPVQNSCLYSTFVVEEISETSKITQPGKYSFYKIYNFLTKEEWGNIYSDTEEYNEVIKELKGE